MKKIRIISFVLTLALILSMFSSLTVSAKTGTLVKNTGVRHEVCTSLSSQAEAYYTGEYTYDNLSSLEPGNESCLDSVDSELFKELHELMESTMTNKSVTYNGSNGLQKYWPYTDANNGSSKPILFYSDYESDSFNREHVWPKSRASFLQKQGGCDLHHLRPTNSSVNTTRSNHTMGNVREKCSSYQTKTNGGQIVLWYNETYSPTDYDTYKENGGAELEGLVEVRDEIKGDVARIFLYVYVRWEEPNLFEFDPNPQKASDDNKNNGYRVIEDLETLLQWCQMDPVDDWEMGRNDQVENVQGNRNVFIDYPELAWLLFGQEIPDDMITPSGEAQNTFQYAVTALSNNTAYGTVSMRGKTITATPNTGYTVSLTDAYSVSPAGAATVKQNGNAFTVSDVTADCTITINFEELVPAAINYIVPLDVTYSGTTSAYVGDTIKLATVSNVPEGFTFYRWSESFVDKTIAESFSGLKPGADYIITEAETTLYAVFYYNEKQDGGWLFTSTPSLCDHENTELRNVAEASCTKNGHTGDTYCLDCGNCIQRGSTIPALGHNYENGFCTRCGDCEHLHTEIRNARKATCTEDGYTGDIYCTDCGERAYPGVTIKAMGHDYEDGVCAKCGQKDPSASDDPIEPETPECYFDDFSDCKDPWYHEAVDYAVDNELMNGVGNGRFDPNGSMTRAMIVTVLYRAAGSPPAGKSGFTDVTEVAWYADAIAWAQEKEIVKGVSDTEFAPNDYVTREQIATILWRYSGSPKAEADMSGFKDTAAISSYAADAIVWAVAEGILNGSGGKLNPTNNATRAEFSCIIMRYLNGSYPCAALK